jgi:HAD superfamily hydrolase (TIGR01484 family)
MRYFALAVDYDGTLAEHGCVRPDTLKALQRLRQTGRFLILVTGRELPDLMANFPEFAIFHMIVAENGALLYDPASKTETLLCQSPPEEFAATLSRNGVYTLGRGRVIVATSENYKQTVLDCIQQLGLELQIIFNKGSLMVLPSGVNKASGLKAALDKLHLSLRNTVGAGDAENDHAFLSICEVSVAVANAIPALKAECDLVTTAASGEGVAELIGILLDTDLRNVNARHGQDSILLGKADQMDVRMPCYGAGLLVAGSPEGGKSTLTTGVMERLIEAGYRFFAIDPEGDYQALEGALLLGDSKREPVIDDIINAIENADRSLIVNLLGIPVDRRPAFLESLYPRIQQLRSRIGRPHWVIVDEAHHLLPETRGSSKETIANGLMNTMLITVEPGHLSRAVLVSVDAVVALGQRPNDTLRKFCSAAGLECPPLKPVQLERGTALFWPRKQDREPLLFSVAPCRTPQVRHSRKYATAELTPDRSFYFRGPQGKLNLRAQNLMTFVQLLEGVDDETWLYHLRRGEYSQWLRENIKDRELADAVAQIEQDGRLPAAQSRNKIKEQIEERFTLPA